MSNSGTSLSKISDKYDAIIIGAGIGGLVCGCYLAKAGMKVLIVEQHSKPGGYCTSFTRKNFVFDTAIRGLVGCNETAILGKILNELGIYKKMNLSRSEIFDIIITPDYKIPIKSNFNETLSTIIDNFPKEKRQILKFFDLLKEPNFLSVYGKLRNITFQELLDQFFSDNKLKSFWNIMRVDTGLPPSRTSAMAGLALCRGYILDGGYYPKGGMQRFSDCLAEEYQRMGGDIIYSSRVKKITITSTKEVNGIILNNKIVLKSNYVISNGDITATYFDLIGEEHLNSEFAKLLKGMKPSTSAFILYLGLNSSLKNSIEKCSSIWYFSRYLSDHEYNFLDEINFNIKCFICVFPSFMDASLAPKNSESLYLYAGAPYKDENFWNKNRLPYEDYLIDRLSMLFPNVRSKIVIKESATPLTFYRYTLNRNGASRGWAATNDQVKDNLISQKSPFKNLYLVGHWITTPVGNGGVAMVAYTGRNAAKIILKNYN